MKEMKNGVENGYPNKIFKMIGKKWVFLVINEINNNDKIRFNQLKSNFKKITSSQLSSILKELENRDLIHKHVFDGYPSRVEYSITTDGKNFLSSVQPIVNWMSNQEHDIETSEVKDPNLLKALVALAVEKALLEVNVEVYEKVLDELEKKYQCYLPDCYEHPEYLIEILRDIYGDSYLAIVKTINDNLKDFENRKNISEFLKKIRG